MNPECVIHMKAIILAAGYAMRLYPLTENTPKALLPIGGRPMLDYLLDSLAVVEEIDEAVLISNHRFAAQFQAWAARAAETWPRLRFTVLDDGTTSNETRLGAVGDIQFAIEKLGLNEEILVAASDDFFTFDLRDFVADYHRHGQNLLLGHRLEEIEDLRRFAVAELDDKGRVLSLEEKPREPKSDIGIYALYIYRADALPLFKQYLDGGNNPDSPGRFPEWLHKRREMRAWLFEGECIDIGTHESYREICERFATR